MIFPPLKTFAQFSLILDLLAKGREKNERKLRPRLGSPDAAQELIDLNNAEIERSKDLTGEKICFL
jgi:hypothetical protein